jgi:hypothetical protein
MEHSSSESYSDTDREPEVSRYEIGSTLVVRCPAKQKKVSSENLLISFLQYMNLMPSCNVP